jgi:hypothetical protein
MAIDLTTKRSRDTKACEESPVRYLSFDPEDEEPYELDFEDSAIKANGTGESALFMGILWTGEIYDSRVHYPRVILSGRKGDTILLADGTTIVEVMQPELVYPRLPTSDSLPGRHKLTAFHENTSRACGDLTRSAAARNGLWWDTKHGPHVYLCVDTDEESEIPGALKFKEFAPVTCEPKVTVFVVGESYAFVCKGVPLGGRLAAIQGNELVFDPCDLHGACADCDIGFHEIGFSRRLREMDCAEEFAFKAPFAVFNAEDVQVVEWAHHFQGSA